MRGSCLVRDEPGKAGTIVRHDAIRAIDTPDERAMLENSHEQRMAADFPECEKNGAASLQMTSIAGDDLHRTTRLSLEQRGHGWSMDHLPGTDAETAFLVAEDEPGRPFTTEFAVAIVEEIVSSIWLHELMLPQMTSPEAWVLSLEHSQDPSLKTKLARGGGGASQRHRSGRLITTPADVVIRSGNRQNFRCFTSSGRALVLTGGRRALLTVTSGL